MPTTIFVSQSMHPKSPPPKKTTQVYQLHMKL